jgi:hypothetical protein
VYTAPDAAMISMTAVAHRPPPARTTLRLGYKIFMIVAVTAMLSASWLEGYASVGYVGGVKFTLMLW